MANNNYPQITSVTSESLQAQIRNLLPSQEGFGTDLMAQNVIVPVIDLTSAAEGSTVPQNLQTAMDFSTGHTTVAGSSSVIINNTGFWRIIINASMWIESSAASEGKLSLSDGLSTKSIWEVNGTSGGVQAGTQNTDIIVFLRAGDSASISSNQSYLVLDASYRQIADVNGALVNPLGFSPQ